MIMGQHAVIRTADVDDAYQLGRLYECPTPRFAMLDQRHEIQRPNLDELREVLAHTDVRAPMFYAVEDKTGQVRGFCNLRGLHTEAYYSEMLIMLFDEQDYTSPLADEVYDFLHKQAFILRKLNKIMAHCLDTEQQYRAFLCRKGFESCGCQREVVYTRGRWHDLEVLALYRDRTEGENIVGVMPMDGSRET